MNESGAMDMDTPQASEHRDAAHVDDESVPPAPPDEPVEAAGGDDSVLADAPDTSTGKQQLLDNDEGRPGPGV